MFCIDLNLNFIKFDVFMQRKREFNVPLEIVLQELNKLLNKKDM